ncbi:hypothetical protein [Clostridium massiliamazoniense]|uniref:hypothetical protein n=1 Tax=Clostridium massiliamazoniense TaxID=1347366 RepID=UPI0006D790AC|nr:hypothetical protein [Clostridium massiliamazoniense]
MKKSAYLLGLFGSIILFFIILSSLVLNYSYNVIIFNFIFLIELILIIIYLVLLNKRYWRKADENEGNRSWLKAMTICLILILPFNLFWAIFSFDNMGKSLIDFIKVLFRSLPNYVVIIPLILSLYLINKTNKKPRWKAQ